MFAVYASLEYSQWKEMLPLICSLKLKLKLKLFVHSSWFSRRRRVGLRCNINYFLLSSTISITARRLYVANEMKSKNVKTFFLLESDAVHWYLCDDFPHERLRAKLLCHCLLLLYLPESSVFCVKSSFGRGHERNCLSSDFTIVNRLYGEKREN